MRGADPALWDASRWSSLPGVQRVRGLRAALSDRFDHRFIDTRERRDHSVGGTAVEGLDHSQSPLIVRPFELIGGCEEGRCLGIRYCILLSHERTLQPGRPFGDRARTIGARGRAQRSRILSPVPSRMAPANC